VNQVNVRTLASALGLRVEEIKSNEETDFTEWLHLAVYSGEQKISAGGTLYGSRRQPRIVRVNSHTVEIVPEGVLFFMTNKDRPGIVGYLGSLMGRHNVNIASMSLSRDIAGGHALTVLNLDSVPPPEMLAEAQKDPDISNVRVVRL
jgi:D-3-phosphoglycerate dehydrogenase